MTIRFGLSLLLILGAIAAPLAQAQETAAPDLLRAAIETACRRPGAPAADLAEAFGGTATKESDRANPGSPVTLSIRHIRLDNGRELRLLTLHGNGQALRVTTELYQEAASGDSRPAFMAMTGNGCEIQLGRQIAYDNAGRQIELVHLDAALRPTGVSEPLNPPVPPAADPGGITVAVVDSGINYTLPRIGAALARDAEGKALGFDFWEMDDRPFDGNPARSPFFPMRHGTRVASVLLDEAPGVRLIAYRYPRPNMARMAALVEDAAVKGARIVALPLGSNRESDWSAFAEAAGQQPGILFVVSAGNDGRDIDARPVYPAALSLDNLLTVTSADAEGRLAEGSNWGASSVDIMVPAENLRVTDFTGAPATASGSSFAVPRVAALAARLLEANPGWSAQNLKAAILKRVTPAQKNGGKLRYGWIAEQSLLKE